MPGRLSRRKLWIPSLRPRTEPSHSSSTFSAITRGARLRAERAHELAPKFFGPLLILSRIDGIEGRRQDALAAARQAAALAPGSRVPRARLARALAESGAAPQARAILAELEREGEPCVDCIVDVQLAVGELDAAVARVERGGFTPGAAYFPKVDPAYDAYRGDPRFRRISRRHAWSESARRKRPT